LSGDPIRELFIADFMASFKLAMEVHDAVARAFEERTGKTLERDSPVTVHDMRRASRILRAEGTQRGSRGTRRRALEILCLNPTKEGA
jgi:hypothetical protein